jgi:hypothetical protein
VIECQNQILGEVLPITGAPYSLNYRSDRVPGRVAANTAKDHTLAGSRDQGRPYIGGFCFISVGIVSRRCVT